MAQFVSQMTRNELQQLIEACVENALLDWFGDPDDGLELREDVRERLLKSQIAVNLGERGKPLDEILPSLRDATLSEAAKRRSRRASVDTCTCARCK